MSHLYNAVRYHELLRDRLLAEFPELREDETALADTLDGVSDLDEAVAAVVRSMEIDDAMVAGAEARIEELKERAGRYAHRIVKKREAIAEAMAAAALKRIVRPDFTLSLTPVRPKVVVTDEAAIPIDYWVVPEVQPRLDKKLVGQALNDGAEVPGCTLSNGSFTITLRRK